VTGLMTAVKSIAVAFDVKPGSCPNPLNVKPFEETPKDAKSMKGGVLPVAILGGMALDVNDIDVSSLLLEGVAPIRDSYEDVAAPVVDGEECECTDAGPDGYMDLTLKFNKSEIVEALGEVAPGDVIELTITGETIDGLQIEGSDCIFIPGGVSGDDDDDDEDEDEDEDVAVADSKVRLLDPVPNPFNPVTRFSYELPEEGFVTLTIYDVRGKLVERLVSEVKSAGTHTVEWNADRMPSGMYFYRMVAGGFVETRKLVLLK